MTIAKIRNLSQFGVVTDVDPYNLPPSAFSMGVNVRFKKGSVEPAPVFRRIPLTVAQVSPRFITTNFQNSGFDKVLTAYKNGRVYSYSAGAETNVSIAGYVDADATTQFTSCHLGDVMYINRPDRVPWSLRVTDAQFQTLTAWDATWRAKILRSCNSSLCAFGITKGATTYPTMVKTSQPATVNTVPGSWDETDPTKNAYENILAEMESGITDALPLGNRMMVYGLRETWFMNPTASNDIWDVDELFGDTGCISANCSVEVDSKHYVFGLDDIWTHDGVSKKSICDGQVRDFIFNSLNAGKTGYFFVKHDPIRKEVRFNYVANDAYCRFTGTEGCNRSAVYYIPEATWTFDDLPFVFGATTSNIDGTGLTYTTVTSSYATIGGSYSDQSDSSKKITLMTGDVSAGYSLTASLYAIDDMGPNSKTSFPVDTNATGPRTLERDGIDLDELPEVENLAGYKVVSTIWPQARLDTDAVDLMFSFGGAANYNQAATFIAAQNYDGDTETRCDFNDGGRYLFMRMTHNDYRWWRLSGFDLDIYENGER